MMDGGSIVLVLIVGLIIGIFAVSLWVGEASARNARRQQPESPDAPLRRDETDTPDDPVAPQSRNSAD
jgi:flagellar basal body-associated protein FliL